MKIKKVFQYDSIDLKIIEREEHYMNSKETITVTRVIAPNGGLIPVVIQRKQSLKSIVNSTIDLLDGFKKRGCNIIQELLKTI